MKSFFITSPRKDKGILNINGMSMIIFIITLLGCKGFSKKPSMCDCKTVVIGNLGGGPNPELRAAAARIIGNDDAIDNPERASRKCQLDYRDEFRKWKENTSDPNRFNTSDWPQFFIENCY